MNFKFLSLSSCYPSELYKVIKMEIYQIYKKVIVLD